MQLVIHDPAVCVECARRARTNEVQKIMAIVVEAGGVVKHDRSGRTTVSDDGRFGLEHDVRDLVLVDGKICLKFDERDPEHGSFFAGGRL